MVDLAAAHACCVRRSLRCRVPGHIAPTSNPSTAAWLPRPGQSSRRFAKAARSRPKTTRSSAGLMSPANLQNAFTCLSPLTASRLARSADARHNRFHAEPSRLNTPPLICTMHGAPYDYFRGIRAEPHSSSCSARTFSLPEIGKRGRRSSAACLLDNRKTSCKGLRRSRLLPAQAYAEGARDDNRGHRGDERNGLRTSPRLATRISITASIIQPCV